MKPIVYYNEKPRYGGTLVECVETDIYLMNPVLSSDSASSKINSLLFESLITFDKDMNIIPHLAHSWEISYNKLEYTFYLREDIFWHDGEQLTADDVLFTWERILDPQTYSSDYSKYLSYLDTSTEPIVIKNDFIIEFYFKSRINENLNAFLIPIIPQHAYENYLGDDGIPHTADDCRNANGTYTFNDDPINTASGGKIPIGTGCMMFESWYQRDNVTLIRNSKENGGPGYWDGHDAYLDNYVLRIIKDHSCQFQLLINGTIHLIDPKFLSYSDLHFLESNKSFTVYRVPRFAYDSLAFQCDPSKGNLYCQEERDFEKRPNYLAGFKWQAEKYPSLNITGYLVRRALNYALNKTKIIEKAYHIGLRQLGPVSQANRDIYKEDLNPYTFNLQKANQLLDQAGFGTSSDHPKRKLLNITLSFNQGSYQRPKTCQEVKRQWESNLGINVNVKDFIWLDFETYYVDRHFDVLSNSGFGDSSSELLKKRWHSAYIKPRFKPIDLDDKGQWVWSHYAESIDLHSTLNDASYWNPVVDRLLEDLEFEEDKKTQKTLYHQIQKHIVDDAPYIFLWSEVNMYAFNNSFHGFVKDSLVGLWPEPIGFHNVYLYTKSEDTSVIVPPSFLSLTKLTVIFMGLSGLGLLGYILHVLSSQRWRRKQPIKSNSFK